MSMTPEGKMMQARIVLRNEADYIADLLIYLQPEFTKEKVERMGVDNKGKLYANPDWVDTLTPDNVIAVMIHEVLHVAYMHPFRDPPPVLESLKTGQISRRVAFLHHLFNVACDLKINYTLYEIGRAQHLPPTELMPTRYGTWTEPRKPENAHKKKLMHIDGIDSKSVEQIFNELLKQYEEEEKNGGGGASDPQYSQVDDHSMWVLVTGDDDGEGEGEGEGEGQGQSTREAAGDWMVRVAGALNAHKGTMPASLVRALEDMLEPKVDWRSRLQRFVQPVVAADLSYRRPRRTSWVTGIILPGPERGGVRIITHVDTSGSMGDEELKQIAGELYGILDSHPHVEITMLHSDAGPPKAIELRETDKELLSTLVTFEGGGGTSHKPVVEWVLANNDEAVEALICFTDGDSDIQHCFDDLAGHVVRMLMITREHNIDRLAPYCDDVAHLPVG